jgi:hypothetical protein
LRGSVTERERYSPIGRDVTYRLRSRVTIPPIASTLTYGVLKHLLLGLRYRSVTHGYVGELRSLVGLLTLYVLTLRYVGLIQIGLR